MRLYQVYIELEVTVYLAYNNSKISYVSVKNILIIAGVLRTCCTMTAAIGSERKDKLGTPNHPPLCGSSPLVPTEASDCRTGKQGGTAGESARQAPGVASYVLQRPLQCTGCYPYSDEREAVSTWWRWS